MPRRLALLVATYHYQDPALRQLVAPGNDAQALADILRHPDIAGFDVTILVNKPNHVVGRTIGEFYQNRRSDDLALLYFTGHGLKDDYGDLYLAMTDTRRDNLVYTAVSAQHINRSMESCVSRRKVLVLDCCYSGAFPPGRIPKADSEVHTLERFQGKGRVVLTASDATQYSFEGNERFGHGARSVFTHFLVEGLTTGKGDLNHDGDIGLDELYSYVYDRVVEEMPQQRPKKQEDVEGHIILARNIHWTLPSYIFHAMRSPTARDRLMALDGLAHLYRIGNSHVRVAVIERIQELACVDMQEVSVAAKELLRNCGSEKIQQESEKLVQSKTEMLVTANFYKILGGVAAILLLVAVVVKFLGDQATTDQDPVVDRSDANADPCALLIDPKELEIFGESVEPSVPHQLEGCEFTIETNAGGEADVRVILRNRPVSESGERGGPVNDVTVSFDDSFSLGEAKVCQYLLKSASRELVEIRADIYHQPFPADACVLAKVAADGSAEKLRSNGFTYRPHRTDEYAIARSDSCSLLDGVVLDEIPGLNQENRSPGYANWSCYWGEESSLSVSLEFILDERDLGYLKDPVLIAGKKVYLDKNDEERCRALVAHRLAPPTGGVTEVFAINVDASLPQDQLCGLAEKLVEAAEKKLPD